MSGISVLLDELIKILLMSIILHLITRVERLLVGQAVVDFRLKAELL